MQDEIRTVLEPEFEFEGQTWFRACLGFLVERFWSNSQGCPLWSWGIWFEDVLDSSWQPDPSKIKFCHLDLCADLCTTLLENVYKYISKTLLWPNSVLYKNYFYILRYKSNCQEIALPQTQKYLLIHILWKWADGVNLDTWLHYKKSKRDFVIEKLLCCI